MKLMRSSGLWCETGLTVTIEDGEHKTAWSPPANKINIT